MTGIYMFTNKITGMSYIGQSVNIERRYKDHKSKHDDTLFHVAIFEHGFENFDFKVLEECKICELDEKEIGYIKQYDTIYPNGYNKTPGGNIGHVMTLKSFSEIDEIIKLLKETKLTNGQIGELFGVSDQMVSDINCGRSWRMDDTDYPIRPRRKRPCHIDIGNSGSMDLNELNHYCSCCGSELKGHLVNGTTKTGLCLSCYNRDRSKHIPQRDELLSLLSTNSKEAIGRMYGVSGKTVANWCAKRGIPKHRKDL